METSPFRQFSIDHTVKTICSRALPEGGFAGSTGGSFRPDDTAWAVLALSAGHIHFHSEVMESACNRLVKSQLDDGRIPIIKEQSKSYWPTYLAILAWNKVPGYENAVKKALNFTLRTTGIFPKKKNDFVLKHDPSIRGWPWIENTHPWIEPTSLAIIALKSSGYSHDERVREGVKMILDRQLPSGGWNYGNPVVFGKELLPMPVSTGHALAAISGSVERDIVEQSLKYLQNEVTNLRTPLSLAWSIFGLNPWSRNPSESSDWIIESLSLQKRYGNYSTALLSQLLLAYLTQGDLMGFLT